MRLIDQLREVIRPLRTSLVNSISRSVVKVIDDSKTLQSLQILRLGDETREDVERVQNYGFTSYPKPDAEAIVLNLGASPDHLVVIAVDDRRYRLKGLAEGEVAVYTDQGDKMVFKRGGTIEITASTKVKIITPTVEFTGDLNVAGTVTGTTDVVGGGKSLKNHTHPGSSLTTTATVTGSPPAGVIGGNTGAPN